MHKQVPLLSPFWIVTAIVLSLGWILPSFAEVPYQHWIDTLNVNQFKCEEHRKKNLCAVTYCEGAIPGYPLPVGISIPHRPIESIRTHLHGFLLTTTGPYDKSLRTMIQALNFEDSICKNSEAVIFPRSSGRNDTYLNTFTSVEDFNAFLKNVLEALDTTPESLKSLTISGHSGAGKIISIIHGETLVPTKKIVLLDALYSNLVADTLGVYLSIHPEIDLVLSSVKASSTEEYTKRMMSILAIPTGPRAMKIKGRGAIRTDLISIEGQTYQYSNFMNRRAYFRLGQTVPNPNTIPHYEIAKEIWSVSF